MDVVVAVYCLLLLLLFVVVVSMSFLRVCVFGVLGCVCVLNDTPTTLLYIYPTTVGSRSRYSTSSFNILRI